MDTFGWGRLNIDSGNEFSRLKNPILEVLLLKQQQKHYFQGHDLTVNTFGGGESKLTVECVQWLKNMELTGHRPLANQISFLAQ